MDLLASTLLEAADRLDGVLRDPGIPNIEEALGRLEDAATQVGKAWSGSWLGHHSRVYYRDLIIPPPGDHFSQEWGLMQMPFLLQGSLGAWTEYSFDDVVGSIERIAGNPDWGSMQTACSTVSQAFEDSRAEVLSALAAALERSEDSFLSELKTKAEATKTVSATEYLLAFRPSRQLMSRDTIALTQGLQTPPHLDILLRTMALRSPLRSSRELSRLARQAAAHLDRRERYAQMGKQMGSKVFIGHGRSPIWRELKDFIQDRLRLPWDEFNGVPVAGVTNAARLAQMLDEAAIAFLILTGEDEQADGSIHARMNVIHEAGLFQGRLGFTRAIIILEEGCEEFSNVQGIGYIPFPKGLLAAVLEEVRRVLEREGLA